VSTQLSELDADLLLARARRGDREAFGRLCEAHRHGLQLHCYRMTGSLHDAEDAVQEALLRAWRRLDSFEQRGPFRGWLQRIATNACLDALERRPRRVLPESLGGPAEPTVQPGAPAEVPWLEPYPDSLFEALPDESPGPEARYDLRESVELAFVAAIQFLPSRQRAVLLLRDVLGWPAAEVAALLGTSVASANSLLQRARRTLDERRPLHRWHEGSPGRLAARERELLARFVRAWESSDLDGVARLLREDAVMSMPPQTEWYAGRDATIAFLRAIPFGPDGLAPFTVLATRANGQPAFGFYPAAQGYQAMALAVLTLQEGLIGQITGFVDPALMVRFGLPPVAERRPVG
jgi:RNA polymerase sigma-70 factor (ECF subfamily)